ncbi:flavin reductase family protein [Agarilytica rhodophyticola]|uniref:flavin reductase family protein n=1 Tax=Agarilytica rhodophyticola TaxID=1737490 RepID=UPI000B343254|nr:flavin reductase family protein [Agarilytica rhodophyticola]
MSNEQELSVALKQGMRNLASGVCVISALTEDGERVAMTASSVTSVSDAPPSLLVCVNKAAKMDSALAKTSDFTVNILSKDQQEVSNTCAKPAEGESRFNVGNWSVDKTTGLSYLEDALSVFICEKSQVVPYGTHNIYIGNIRKVHFGSGEPDILVYAKGAYYNI